MQPNSRIWNKRRIQIKQCNGWMSWSQMYSLSHATDCFACMSAIKDQLNLRICAIQHMNGNRHPCSVLQQHSKPSEELWKICQALTAKTWLRQGQWHMFYKEFYNFLFPSWLCQDRQERPITAAAAITRKFIDKIHPQACKLYLFFQGQQQKILWLHCRQVCLESSSIFWVFFVCRKSRGGGE